MQIAISGCSCHGFGSGEMMGTKMMAMKLNYNMQFRSKSNIYLNSDYHPLKYSISMSTPTTISIDAASDNKVYILHTTSLFFIKTTHFVFVFMFMCVYTILLINVYNFLNFAGSRLKLGRLWRLFLAAVLGIAFFHSPIREPNPLLVCLIN